MNYIERTLERKFLRMNEAFKAIMVVGARQVGKSTMLKHFAQKQNRTVVSMDDARLRDLAKSDPVLFFQTYRPPILIDEVQKAPELFEQIKIICDNSSEKGLFWLTGSQSKKLMKQAGDSLAGRVCILKMYSLSQKEIAGIQADDPMELSFDSLRRRSEAFTKNNILDVFSHIWRGGMPELLQLDDEQTHEYWNSYVDTYLMRDAVDDNGIADTEGFRKFLRACAGFAGQLLNYNDLAQASGISGVTAKEWLKILQTMGIVFLLEPLHSNELKRLIKTPKLYFCDTGLCAWLSSWTSRDTLMNGAAAGHYFENYVVGEFLRAYAYGTDPANLNFYRDTNQKEIDFVIEQNGILHPLEIKLSSNPDKRDIKVFSALENSGKQLGPGGIVCMTEEPFPINVSNSFIPANII
ncbi:MAG: ATP-binding protein [Clostridia bacterium]|nr:ATP-binding protein [Clostridia bacterium]